MSNGTSRSGAKRKATENAVNSHARKRQKHQDARNIVTQTADTALSKTGELNITSFIKAREFEINALDKSMRRARQDLATRAFQQVPRSMRRRTASHNAKKVPRRLRRRAEREMIEDNTPTVTARTRTPTSSLRLRLATAKTLSKVHSKWKSVRQRKKESRNNRRETNPATFLDVVRVPRIKKNQLAQPPQATVKYKRRQVGKTWLPTHLWHTKRAKMTRPVEPLWRMAIPLTPTEKSYRTNHRASESRGCVAWDTSYVSTIGCLGTDSALEGLLKNLGFAGEGWLGSKYRKWRDGRRFSSSWIRERTSRSRMIAPVTVVWNISDVRDACDVQNDPARLTDKSNNRLRRPKLSRRLLILVHPSAFWQSWQEILRLAKHQKPQVLVEDLRFEVGSIEVTGPASSEALVSAVRPADSESQMATIWAKLSTLSNPALLPKNALLSFNAVDPRLRHPPEGQRYQDNETDPLLLSQLTVEWPIDQHAEPSSLFSHRARYKASRLPSQKAINRRKAKVAPGHPVPPTDMDVSIPIILLSHRCRSGTSNQGSWTLLAPWKCIDPIWRSLMYCPLVSGGKPRFGGLREQQQIAFERETPWFPGDWPGTEAGKAWHRSQEEARFDQWIRKPTSRRLAFDSIDLGLNRRGELGQGWACDWSYLFQHTCEPDRVRSKSKGDMTTRQVSLSAQPIFTQRQRKAAKAAERTHLQSVGVHRNTSSPETEDANGANPDRSNTDFVHLSPLDASVMISGLSLPSLPKYPALFTVRIALLSRGTPNPTARIYRLPRLASLQPAILPNVHDALDASGAPNLNSSPPAAQRSPVICPPDVLNSTSKDKSSELRIRWLALDPRPSPTTVQPQTRVLGKAKANPAGLPPKHRVLPAESLRHVTVLPKNAAQEVIDTYGQKPLTEAEEQAELDKLLQIRVEEEKVWDVHVPCPDAQDLIGFVTSGGYNLAQGKGTAIGALWIQRLLEQWSHEELQATNVDGARSSKDEKKHGRQTEKQRARERRLCIVRNSGESVGRLATWELCE